MSRIIPTYNRLPIEFVKGNRCWLQDIQGDWYLDALSGISVVSLGHAHPRLTAVLNRQAENLWHTSNLYQITAQQVFAEKLCEVAKMHSCFVCNSGTEANEAAIKLARLYGHKKHIESPKILVFSGSFHGRTMGALSATNNETIKQGFAPLLAGFVTAEFNDVSSLNQVAKNHPDVVAVMFEPVQGEGGINIASSEFLQAIRDLAERQDWLIICDEIQSGMGRSGTWFSFHQQQLNCDVLTVAKALGNGFPIGACLVNHKAVDLFAAGKHGSTFGGNPLACVVASEVIDIFQQEKIPAKVNHLAATFKKNFAKYLSPLTGVVSIRQLGLLIGIELDTKHYDTTKITHTALDHRLLVNVTAGNIVRLLPPFILTDEEVELVVKRLAVSLFACQISS